MSCNDYSESPLPECIIATTPTLCPRGEVRNTGKKEVFNMYQETRRMRLKTQKVWDEELGDDEEDRDKQASWLFLNMAERYYCVCVYACLFMHVCYHLDPLSFRGVGQLVHAALDVVQPGQQVMWLPPVLVPLGSDGQRLPVPHQAQVLYNMLISELERCW